jgi:hypothetical protein
MHQNSGLGVGLAAAADRRETGIARGAYFARSRGYFEQAFASTEYLLQLL